jgi:hypothetical protein
MRKTMSALFASTALLTGLLSGGALSPSAVAATAPKTLACDDSIKTEFKPDLLTSVIAVKSFKKGDPLVMAEPVTEYTPKALNDLCFVKLNVGPGNPGPADAPSTSKGIGIEVWLPTPANWDGRLHAIGGLGGLDGGNHGSATKIGWLMAPGFAGVDNAVSASTDTGHTGGTWGMNPDGSINRALWTDYAGRAHHQLAEKTKALIFAYYGRPAKYSYYEGASSGGRHGYEIAQRYPDDYDGIIPNLPATPYAQWTASTRYKTLVMERDLGAPLTEEQEDLVSDAAIHACDVVGGQLPL